MDDFTYTVRKLDNGHYEVTKWGDQAPPVEQYDVTLPPPDAPQHMQDKVWCNCQGFRRQNYPKPKHKHIVLVKWFMSQGEPEGRVYKMVGKRDNVQIVVVKDCLVDSKPFVVPKE